ncbi:unnamed protein product [Sphagnum balticum]
MKHRKGKGGRPPIADGKNKVISLRLANDVLKRIGAFADADQRETSAAIRLLIEDGLKTFDERKESKRSELTKVLIGTLDEHAEELTRLNNSGAGIFVQVNAGNRRGAGNISGLRALFVDKDDGALVGLKIKPTILVQAKRGMHAYWRLRPGEPLGQFKPAQKSLIHYLATDISIHNLDRVMRLPGFYHMKDTNNPFMVPVLEANDVTYSINDILNDDVYPEWYYDVPKLDSKKSGGVDNDTRLDCFKDWVSCQPVAEGERNTTVVRIVREGLGQRIGGENLRLIVEEYCHASGLPLCEGTEILERHILQHKNEPFEPFIRLGSQTYDIVNRRIVWNKPSSDGQKEIPLCNFDARIVREETHDDGAEKKTLFSIDGTVSSGEPLPKISISSEEFAVGQWPTKHWGSRAIVYVGKESHLRVAIQELSRSVDRVVIYRHTGWRQINGEYVYLHGNGAIGVSGSTQRPLKDYGAALVARLQVNLIGMPTSRVLAFLSGPTGCFKSSLIGAMQAHFGAAFNTSHLPDNWTSTENSLEKKAFLLKDCIFTIDEWTPTGTNAETDRLKAKAERILRSQGNQSGRGRMTATCDVRPEYYPRGAIISTGEDMPQGHSLRARTLQIELSHGDINAKELSKLQDAAAKGLLSQAASAFIKWLAPRIPHYKKYLPRVHSRLKRKISLENAHNRTPDVAASLGVGLWIFLKFAADSGAIDKSQRRQKWQDGWSAICDSADEQRVHQQPEDLAEKFVGYIKYGLTMGVAYLEKDSGLGYGSVGASKIGWLSGDEVCLHPDAAFSMAQELARSRASTLQFPKTHSGRDWHNVASSLLMGQRTEIS